MRTAFRTSAAMLAITASTAVGGTLLTAAPAAAAPAPAPVTSQQDASGSVSSGGVGTQAAAASNYTKAVKYMKLKHTDFVKSKKVKPFIWKHNGCSVPTGYAPYMVTFTKSCIQHDFGYRNFGSGTKGGLKLKPTQSTKTWIDARFRTEMKRACKTKYKKGNPLKMCNKAADAYWTGVRVGGKKAFFG